MNIYVANIAYSATTQQLKDLFTPFGEVSKATIVTDKDSGRSRGFAFVEMNSDVDAITAINKLNGVEFNGRNLLVKEANERPAKKK